VARTRYDYSQETVKTVITAEEVQELYEARGRPLGARGDAIVHFLYRTMLTLNAKDRNASEMRKQIEKMRTPKQRLGTPTTLSPLDAVKFAAPEELAAIMGHINTSQLNALQQAVLQAQARADALGADLAAVRTATQAVLNRPDLPADARVAFVQLLNGLPEAPAPVETPRMLDMARVTGMVDTPSQPLPRDTQALGAGAQPAPAPAPHELPDAEVTTTAGPDAITIHPMSATPAWAPAPAWVAGPGPALGS
jgi:hypothetical protein